jgi:TusA-related sulfurtransferase
MLESKSMKKENKNKRLKPSLSIDAIGLYCPMPIVKLKLGLEETNTNEMVELLSDYPGVEEDLVQWCYATGNTLLSVDKEKDIFTAYIKKTGR